MISRIERKWLHIRRLFSRSHWLTRMLGLPVRKGQSNRPGLVMIQIDGLSRPQFERAVKNGEMPFLKKLMTKENYHLHTNYSGLPASTPAVQAEIFYGIKTVVPAFSFMDHESREIIRMYEPAGAAKVEQRIVDGKYIGLLSGGSAYSDNFTGGAKEEEAHFCASSMGWGAALQAANPFALLILLLSNLNSVLRIIAFSLLEVVISFVDFARGVAHGRNFLKELKFIPTRVAICIMLRELCVIGGKIDISRGLPIIHINFLGYDEQAHRRGPASKFAHWTLKGIDDAIKRLAREASLSRWRNYEVWMYSDHGQSVATSYVKCRGYSIREAVNQAMRTVEPHDMPIHTTESAGVETHRVRLLGGNRTQRVLKVKPPTPYSTNLDDVQVVGLGPVGFVNFPHTLVGGELARIAKELVFTHKVPVVISGREGTQLRAYTEEGEFLLPQQTAEVFGDDHPFLKDIGEDLERLCRHVDGGDLTLLGWKKNSENITFATENGSHAGLTHGETTAFSLLPQDAPLANNGRAYYRPTELREAALRHLGRLTSESQDKCSESASDSKKTLPNSRSDTGTLRLMTYNIHSGVGIDGKLAVERIAKVIARINPDVAALQEVDVGKHRSGHVDQAEIIARHLKMNFHFHPTMHVEDEKYGDAILTHHPLKLIKADSLPSHLLPNQKRARKGNREPRGAIWVVVEINGVNVNIINTHLGLSLQERRLQIEELMGKNWLGHPDCQGPVIICGDFNAVATSGVCRRLRRELLDVQKQLPGHRPKNTFYSRMPIARIDHIFVSKDIRVTSIEVPRNQLTLVASDHLPLVADLLIE